jgi:lipopolysaccharide/colanic/teichoic acid biosynthesis glycosyltransferase
MTAAQIVLAPVPPAAVAPVAVAHPAIRVIRPRRLGRRLSALALPGPAEALRRTLNVTVAALGLVVSAPVMAAIALAIKLTSRGPVFYTQTRVGINRRRKLPAGRVYRDTDRGGKPFKIFKFRTMAENGHGPNDPAEVWATPNDPRVTRIGRILRLYRLDELPQLLNVLRGDMDIVGPRPEQPTIFSQMRRQIDLYQERQSVRPGITGWAQINQQYDTSVEDVRKKLQYDLEYIGRRCLTEDLRIMLRTLPVVVGKSGAW